MGDAVQRPKTEMELAKAIAEIIFSESAVLCDQLAEENELEPRVLVETVICFFLLADVVIARRVRTDWVSPDLREDVLDRIRGCPQFSSADKAAFDDILSKRMGKYIAAFAGAQSFGVFNAVAAVLAGYALAEPLQGPMSLVPIGFMAGAVLGVFESTFDKYFQDR